MNVESAPPTSSAPKSFTKGKTSAGTCCASANTGDHQASAESVRPRRARRLSGSAGKRRRRSTNAGCGPRARSPPYATRLCGSRSSVRQMSSLYFGGNWPKVSRMARRRPWRATARDRGQRRRTWWVSGAARRQVAPRCRAGGACCASRTQAEPAEALESGEQHTWRERALRRSARCNSPGGCSTHVRQRGRLQSFLAQQAAELRRLYRAEARQSAFERCTLVKPALGDEAHREAPLLCHVRPRQKRPWPRECADHSVRRDRAAKGALRCCVFFAFLIGF